MLEPATINVAYCTAFGPLGMDKPVLTTVPLRYTFGTHSAVALSPGGPGHKAFSCHSMHSDEQLFNLHLKCIDLTAWQHGQKAPFGKAQFRLLRLLGRARWFWPASTPRGRPGPWAPVPKLGRSSEPPPMKAPLVPPSHLPAVVASGVDRRADGLGPAAQRRGGQRVERVGFHAGAMLSGAA